MNANPLSHPRFTCRVIRSSRAVFADAGKRHISQCADCQAFVHASETLTRELHREAGAVRQVVPAPTDGFERRILAAVRAEQEPVAARPWPYRSSTWAIATVAAIAVVSVLLFQRLATQTRALPATPEDAAIIVNAVESLSVKLTGTVIPKTGAVVANNPLQQELGFVYSDARSALGFLAVNFLPTDTRPTATPRS